MSEFRVLCQRNNLSKTFSVWNCFPLIISESSVPSSSDHILSLMKMFSELFLEFVVPQICFKIRWVVCEVSFEEREIRTCRARYEIYFSSASNSSRKNENENKRLQTFKFGEISSGSVRKGLKWILQIAGPKIEIILMFSYNFVN